MNRLETSDKARLMQMAMNYDLPLRKVYEDLEKLYNSGEYADDEILDELEFYYKCKAEGW